MPRKDRLPANPGSPKLESLPVEGARELVTLGPDHVVWRGWEGRMPISADGAIVRVRPPEGATDEEVQRVVENLRSTGAAAVRVEPRRRSAVVPRERERKPHARARDVVLEIARQSNVEDVPRLESFCEAVMAKAGV